MIISIDKEGNKRRVFYNQNIIMVDREDKLSFSVKDEPTEIDITLNFDFSDEGKELSTSGNISDDGKILNMTLFQWNNSVAAELTKPIELATLTGKKIWMKFKTSADKKNSFRSFHLTLWVEE